MIPRKQIGFSNEENLLWEISRQLDRAFIVLSTGGAITTTTTTTISQICTETPVTIGTQTWDKCNLNVSTYRNGDAIPFASNETEWSNYINTSTGAWCYYDYNPANELVYGKIYNLHAVRDVRNLAPVGKHIPTTIEWVTLSSFLGVDAGGKMKQAGTSLWLSPNTGATNLSGFTGLPGGTNSGGSFFGINENGFWWDSTITGLVNGVVYLSHTDANLTPAFSAADGAFSVRCLID
jgi:uncharacterized protein (TIGR02145 family)